MNRLFSLFFIIILGCFLQAFAGTSTLPYDYSDTHSVPVKLSIVEPISTKDGLLEGSKLKFKVKDDVKYNGQLILKKDTIVTGILETVVPRGMNGFPAEIIVDNFEFTDISSSKLISTYTKKGQNRCLLVYPLKWALTPIPFVGSTTNFILGGHAKIKKIGYYHYTLLSKLEIIAVWIKFLIVRCIFFSKIYAFDMI